jgi:hypothetical protein
MIAKIIYKMDIEGAEYEIMRDLVDNYRERFDRVDIINRESHLGFDEFPEIVQAAGQNYAFEYCNHSPNNCCSFFEPRLSVRSGDSRGVPYRIPNELFCEPR